jgi:endonuclease YncB( thermonuclease family)
MISRRVWIAGAVAVSAAAAVSVAVYFNRAADDADNAPMRLPSLTENCRSEPEKMRKIFPKSNTHLQGKVIAVHDGDTLTLWTSTQEKVVIRIWGIDAPELKQVCEQNNRPVPCGPMAQKALSQMALGQGATCYGFTNHYERVVAKCDINGVDVAAQMVRTGMAFNEIKISRGFYHAQEAQACKEHTGIWDMYVPDPSLYRLCKRLKPNNPERPANCP